MEQQLGKRPETSCQEQEGRAGLYGMCVSQPNWAYDDLLYIIL